ncbi:DUF2334 domain-containing protein [Mucilaginibacter terrae]|uniref:DUF2334 domain-containing protein n=1 Tax=Mucilaginibacter terrae TaxID=1955052 RepID=UPI0036405924
MINLFKHFGYLLLSAGLLHTAACKKGEQVSAKSGQTITAALENQRQTLAVTPGPYIILKLDDFGSDNSINVAATTLNYLKQNNIKTALGVIADRLSADAVVYDQYINAKNTAGEKLFEIWHHGLLHNDLGGGVYEFKGTTYAYQKNNFEMANQKVLSSLGVQMHSFGAPYNRNDAVTNQVIGENASYKVTMFTNPQPVSPLLSLNNKLEMESSAGVIDSVGFMTQYMANKSTYAYMVIQGHPNQWNATEKATFINLMEFLVAENCRFILPYDYYYVAKNIKSTIYSAASFGGTSAALGIGTYNKTQLTALGINSIMSIKVPDGLKATLFEGDNFNGSSAPVTTTRSAFTSLTDISSVVVSAKF